MAKAENIKCLLNKEINDEGTKLKSPKGKLIVA